MYAREGALVTFDLDSTLCDTDHRSHLISREGGTDWDAYSNACSGDTPVQGVVTLVQLLVAGGAEAHALSGRKVSALSQTTEWLEKHSIPISRVWLDESAQGDYVPGQHSHEKYKLARLREIEKITGRKVVLHIDDWASVAATFEKAGIPCVCVRTPREIADLSAGKVSSALR